MWRHLHRNRVQNHIGDRRGSGRLHNRVPRGGRVQRGDQSGIVTGRFSSRGRQSTQDCLDAIKRGQNLAHDIRRRGQGIIPQLPQDILSRMSDPFQSGQTKKPAGALNGMHHAEDQRKRSGIVGRTFQRHQRDIEFGEAFVGLGQEVGEQIIHWGPPWRPAGLAGAD